MPDGIMEKFEEFTGAPQISKFMKESPEKLKLLQEVIREIRLLMAEAGKGGFEPGLAHEAFSLLRVALDSTPQQLEAMMGLIKETKELVKVAGKSGLSVKELIGKVKEE